MFQPGMAAQYVEHEVRQPLAAILTNAQAALRWLNRDSPDLAEVRQAIERIVANSHRARAIVDNAPGGIGTATPMMSALNINGAIEDMIRLLAADLDRGCVVVETQFAPDLQPVLGNRDQLQQVVANLVTNGIEAMRTVDGRPRTLRFATCADSTGGVQVSIADSGIGFDPALADQLFNPHFTTKNGGMGIGLSICRSILDAHGGRLWAEPNLPHGSIFRFAVPVTSSERHQESQT